MNNEIILSVDLGGTNLRVSAVDRDGNILYRTRRETPRTNQAAEIISAITDDAEVCREAVKSMGEVLAIGTVVPGTVNVEQGIIRKAPNVTALDGFSITEAVRGSC